MTESLHPEELITSIIFLRHGHTRETEAGKLYTDPSAMLTEQGVEQSKKAADWLKQREINLLLCSPATRVLATAEILSQELNLTPQTVADLNEQFVGDWEGRTYLDIKKNDPDIYQDWCSDPIRKRPPNGESIEDVYNRVRTDLHDIILKHAGKNLVLVTHAGVIRSALIEALGMPLDNFWRLSIPTGSISRVDFSNNFATLHYMAHRP